MLISEQLNWHNSQHVQQTSADAEVAAMKLHTTDIQQPQRDIEQMRDLQIIGEGLLGWLAKRSWYDCQTTNGCSYLLGIWTTDSSKTENPPISELVSTWGSPSQFVHDVSQCGNRIIDLTSKDVLWISPVEDLTAGTLCVYKVVGGSTIGLAAIDILNQAEEIAVVEGSSLISSIANQAGKLIYEFQSSPNTYVLYQTLDNTVAKKLLCTTSLQKVKTFSADDAVYQKSYFWILFAIFAAIVVILLALRWYIKYWAKPISKPIKPPIKNTGNLNIAQYGNLTLIFSLTLQGLNEVLILRHPHPRIFMRTMIPNLTGMQAKQQLSKPYSSQKLMSSIIHTDLYAFKSKI